MHSDSGSPATQLSSEPNWHKAWAVTAGAARGTAINAHGEVAAESTSELLRLLEKGAVLLCHASFTARRLQARLPPRRANLFDVLELYAFVQPAQFCVPTVRGLSHAMEIDPPESLEDQALALFSVVKALLTKLERCSPNEKTSAARAARHMQRAGWAWAPAVLEVIGGHGASESSPGGDGLDVWAELPEWEDRGAAGTPGSEPVSKSEARERLSALVAVGRAASTTEARHAQSDYAALLSGAFAAKQKSGDPHVILAEAGTGIGKTLGYLAPASVWAEKNGPGLWVSTYTKNLQRQIDQELSRLYPDPTSKARSAVIRKGRENYVCLLNLADAAASTDPILVALIARWVLHTRDGDMVGGDFPGWLVSLLPPRLATNRVLVGTHWLSGLTDRRGECIYSACPHYRKCFVEKASRRARHADIVVANHALVMVLAAQQQNESTDHSAPSDHATPSPVRGETVPRIIFDEGHHLFDAADSAFSAFLSGLEMADLRRWILGPEGRRRRGRSLTQRIDDLIETIPGAERSLSQCRLAASSLPGAGWLPRIVERRPSGPAERFLSAIHEQVAARNDGVGETAFGQEALPRPLNDAVKTTISPLVDALTDLRKPLADLARGLRGVIHDDDGSLDTATRIRLESTAAGLDRRSAALVPTWLNMLQSLECESDGNFVDWFSVARGSGRVIDVGLRRHWLDPTLPFADLVLKPAHGVVITSATLRDRNPETEAGETLRDWQSAEVRTGVTHLALPVERATFESPFDYAQQTRVFVVTDVKKNDDKAVAGAYRALFQASGGGGLGLFTAVHRLRRVYDNIAADLEKSGIELLAQHIDPMDTGTLVDIFRAEPNSCLLGTDAVRDGVDVPGDSLRLIVFDRVPWPRPDILHKARRDQFGGRNYDDLITRLRLKQAFGRLIRRSSDRGAFVMLDSALPSRLCTAFPNSVDVRRIELSEAVSEIAAFLSQRPTEQF